MLAGFFHLRLLLGQGGFPRPPGLGGKDITIAIERAQPLRTQHPGRRDRHPQQADGQQCTRPATQGDAARLAVLFTDNNDLHEADITRFCVRIAQY